MDNLTIAVASGKGGAGKTTVSVSMALSADRAVLADCDVEEPNAHLYLEPAINNTETVHVTVPEWTGSCSGCGRCAEICEFNAIAVVQGRVEIFTDLCHSCGGCFLACPEDALVPKQRAIGVRREGEVNGALSFADGLLNVGEVLTPPLIEAVLNKLSGDRLTIIDAPPGSSCPMLEAVRGSDFCLLVTEATPFGLNDVRLALEAVRTMGIPVAMVINRDRGDSDIIETFCQKEDVPILARIPYSREMAVAGSEGKTPLEGNPEMQALFRDLLKQIEGVYKRYRATAGGGQ